MSGIRRSGTGSPMRRAGLGACLVCLALVACDARKTPSPSSAPAAPASATRPATREPRPPTGTFVDREAGTALRIVTYNVLWNTIFADVNAQRAAKFARIVTALDPDVLVLEEIGMSPQDRGKAGSRKRTAADVLKVMQAVAPLPAGQDWHVFQGGDNVIVSRFPLKMTASHTQPPGERDLALALVDLPDDRFAADLYVVGTHFKCCGGTDNDLQRQQQADAIMAWLRDARTLGGNVDVPPQTPLVVLGDLNIVGGPQPLETLLGGDIADEETYGADMAPDWDDSPLTDAHPLHNVQGPDDYTWRDDNQPYKPGRLDYVIYSDSLLEVTKSFVLNTVAMTEPDLKATGLEKYDTTEDDVGRAFDHLPVVVDFRTAQ